MGYLKAIKLSWNNSCDLYSNTPQYPQLHFFWGLLRNHLKTMFVCLQLSSRYALFLFPSTSERKTKMNRGCCLVDGTLEPRQVGDDLAASLSMDHA